MEMAAFVQKRSWSAAPARVFVRLDEFLCEKIILTIHVSIFALVREKSVETLRTDTRGKK